MPRELPNNIDFAWALMLVVKDGKCFRFQIIKELEEKFQMWQIGPRGAFYNKVSNFLTPMKRNGLLENRKRGQWYVTPLGDAVLSEGKSTDHLQFLW